ncbi:MAG: hypothetical protein JKY65_02520 [Planctomycetes bacterium]|nr:hypothetical protein [Planctomycetota bacterium]
MTLQLKTLLPLALLAFASSAFAQDLTDPNIKVEFGTPAQGFRQAFDTEDGVRTKGRLALGPNAVRFEIGNKGQAKLLKRAGKLDGAEISVGLSTRITLPADVTQEELEAAAAELNRRTIFAAAINGTAEVTRRNLGGTVEAQLGGEAERRKTKVVSTRLYLGPIYLNVLAAGATTRGGASAKGGLAVDVNWKEGTLSFGGLAGLNLPKKLSGRGLEAGLIIQFEINRQFVQELKAAIEFVRVRLRSVAAKLRSAGRTVRNVFTGYRGPTADVQKVEKITVSGPAADLSGLSPAQIAERFAPVIYQPTANQHDFLRRMDFDGDWNTKNNWNNSGNADFDKSGYAYFNVQETKTHFYVNYAFYYARRSGNRLTRHENDMASVTVVARKGAALGQEVEMVLTSDGSGLTSYADKAPRRRSFDADRAGTKRKEKEYVTSYKGTKFVDEAGHPFADTARTHAQIWITAKTHSVYAFNGRNDSAPFSGKRGVIYQPGAALKAPSGKSPTVGYALRPMEELKQASNKDGKLRGNEGIDNQARLPWAFDTGLPGLVDGAMLRNPAKALARMFKLGDDYSLDYVKRKGASAVLAGASGN